jgi:hypothetical protein
MRKLLLIATLSLATFAWVNTAAGNMADTQRADEASYQQTIAAHADLHSRVQAAIAASAASPGESDRLSGSQPSSMASNAGLQSASEDFYNQTIAAQANLHSLAKAANQF